MSPCGVVSLLDRNATEKVARTWARLEQEFGVRGVLAMPYPHFSYQIAQGYERPALDDTLTRLARGTPPFTATTSGIGTFEGGWPVVYVAVEAPPALRDLHERIWNACQPHVREPVGYYRPGTWVPHISLAHGDEHNTVPLPPETIARILATLDPPEYRWSIRIDNLALVWDEGEIQRPVATFRLHAA
ncbi:MAG TPA: 2'-5' RNA ligase family protein [Thermoplasmata archaeon]|nr:2'-5' RNA ligase family protein [Thermoplasmata archaeon]